MIIAHIEGATRICGKAQGYLGLPLRDELIIDSVSCESTPAMVTAWTPTPEELAALNSGASVHVLILGTTPAPMMVMVGPAPDQASPVARSSAVTARLREIQVICSREFGGEKEHDALNDIFRIVNFALHDAPTEPQAAQVKELADAMIEARLSSIQHATDKAHLRSVLADLYEWCRGCNDFRLDSSIGRRVQSALSLPRPNQPTDKQP